MIVEALHANVQSVLIREPLNLSPWLQFIKGKKPGGFPSYPKLYGEVAEGLRCLGLTSLSAVDVSWGCHMFFRENRPTEKYSMVVMYAAVPIFQCNLNTRG